MAYTGNQQQTAIDTAVLMQAKAAEFIKMDVFMKDVIKRKDAGIFDGTSLGEGNITTPEFSNINQVGVIGNTDGKIYNNFVDDFNDLMQQGAYKQALAQAYNITPINQTAI
jgi:hypothetical protein